MTLNEPTGVRPARNAAAIAWLLISVGCVLRLWIYFNNHSLWLDELMLIVNLQERSLGELFEPLTYGQNAPIAWRLLVKLITMVFGESEYAWRLLPVVCSMATLPVLWTVAHRLVGPGWALIALGMLALGRPSIAYAAQVKQYASDPLVALLITWAAIAYAQRGGHVRLLVLTLVGIVSLFFSQPAIFTVAAVGLVLFIRAIARKQLGQCGQLVAIGGVWIAAFAVNYYLFLKLKPDWDWTWLYDYWKHGFMPMPPTSIGELFWLPSAVSDVFDQVGGLYILGPLGAALLGIGLIHLAMRDRMALGWIAMPLVFTLIASALAAYPFAERLVLYLVPFLWLGAAAGVKGVTELLARAMPPAAGRRAGMIVTAGLCIVLALTVGEAIRRWVPDLKPITPEDNRAAMASLAKHYEQGDGIVISFWGRFTWWHYGPKFGFAPEAGLITARDDSNYALPVLPALQQVNKPRTWIVVTHYVQYHEDPPDEYIDVAQQYGRCTVVAQHDGAALLLVERDE